MGNNGKCRWGLGFRNYDKFFIFLTQVIPITEHQYFLSINIFQVQLFSKYDYFLSINIYQVSAPLN